MAETSGWTVWAALAVLNDPGWKPAVATARCSTGRAAGAGAVQAAAGMSAWVAPAGAAARVGAKASEH